MLSRVAENLYWMARYLERAEGTARLNILLGRELALEFLGKLDEGTSTFHRKLQ
jgi:uncharacterized alpha-E superfamily protein